MKKLTRILFIALALHVLVSLTVILDPPFLSSTKLTSIYKTYLLPGPFFTESRIVDNYILYLSWKINGEWSQSISPAVDNFNRYYTDFNPTSLYQSRLDRAVYLNAVLDKDISKNQIENKKEFRQLQHYLRSRYVPKHADSIRLIIINKRATNFTVNIDSVYVTSTQ